MYRPYIDTNNRQGLKLERNKEILLKINMLTEIKKGGW
jgi:hypothetical protein